jgi:tRNA U34 5-carboxymethylaminomethyl modifying GTPase MnmE/TrmE
MRQEITIGDLRKMADHAGLKLSDDELERLLPGVSRSKKQAAELRALIAPETEPAGTFQPHRRP